METLVPGSFILWTLVLVIPWLPWRNREILNVSNRTKPAFDEITVVIPARNEADVIQCTLLGLASQSERLKVVLVDDDSDDDTALLASKSPLTSLRIVKGKPLPVGWSGKLWAQHQGLELVETPSVLLLDADIYLDDGML
ncbi:MAG: glycosyltransferase, partial [Methylococcales bacterium]